MIKHLKIFLSQQLKNLLFLPLGLLMAKPFLYGTTIFYLASFVTALAVAMIFRRFLDTRTETHKLEELQLLLEYTSGKISTGRTLESCLIGASTDLSHILGQKSLLKKALNDLTFHLTNQVELQVAINAFNETFCSAKSAMIMSVLPWLRQSGGKIGQYLQSSHRSLTDELAMMKEINAEQSQKVTEAILMSLVPFGFAYLLSQGTSLATLPDAPVWLYLGTIILYSLILGAMTFTGIVLFPNAAKGSKKLALDLPEPSMYELRLASLCLKLWRKYAPFQLDFTLNKLLEQRFPLKANIEQRYFCQKLRYLGAGFALCVPLIVLNPLFLLFAPVIIIVTSLSQDYKTYQEVEQRKTDYRFDYPVWLNSLVVFLSSGLTVPKALELTRLAMQASVGAIKIMHHDFALMQKSFDHGSSLASSLDPIRACCPLAEMQATTELLLRFASDGGTELLELLRLHASHSWQQGRLARRQRLEKRALKLLLPMGLNLLAVLLTAFIPAIASLTQTF